MIIVAILCCKFCEIAGWRQWNYSTSPSSSFIFWKDQFSKVNSSDLNDVPRPRRGHSLVLAGNTLIMFGGVGNIGNQQHIPKTYNIKKVREYISHLEYKINLLFTSFR